MNDEKKETDKTMSKSKLALKDPFQATRNAYWATKKDEGMSYEEFNDLWESMEDYEKKFLKISIRTFGHK
jgi:hypothetical protein